MRKLLKTILLSATLALSSCGALNSTIDKGVDGGKELVTHATEEIGRLKTEVLEEVSQLKTEVLEEVKATVEEVMPKVVETVLNADGVAFLIVTVTGLLGLVVLVALLLLLGAFRTAYRRWQHPRNCPARSQDSQ